MARKKQASNLNQDIMGIIYITLGFLILFSIFSSSSSGILGKFLKQFFFALMGLGTYFFPFLIIFIGFCYIVKNGKINFNKKFYTILFSCLNTLLLIQMIYLKEYYIEDNVMYGIDKLYHSTSVIHGGILCYLIDIPIYRLIGFAGAYLIFSSIYLICFVLLFNISLGNFLMILSGKFHSIKSIDKNSKIDPLIDHAEPEIVCEIEKNNFLKTINNKIKIIDFMKSSEQPLEENNNIPQVQGITDKNDAVENIQEELKKEIEEHSTNSALLYELPTIDLLTPNNMSKLNKDDKKELILNANKLEETLNSFGVEAKVLQVTKGPSVTRFELQPNAGVKVSKIVNLADDIALNLAASGVRIEAPIPGKAAVGIEVPNKDLSPVYLREVIESDAFVTSNKNLAFCLGKDIGGNCIVSDLSKMPHMLVAGATGSGKSVCINSLIISLLYKYLPEDVKLLMIDPKVVELSVYNGIPHLLIPVVTDPKKAAGALNWAVNEMTKRYKIFADTNVRNIESYNDLYKKGKIDAKMPWIIIIIDELADLMMVCAKDIEDYIGRLAQMARAAGMHLVIATQRPSVDVITGVIKANIPSRISFAVSSQIDSRTIIDSAGAEKLLGKGDMLFYPVGEAKPIRIQGAFISEEEVENVVTFIKSQMEEPEYRSEILEEINISSFDDKEELASDELMTEAIKIVVEVGQASTSLLQRRLRIGYNRAARIIEEMEVMKVISSKDGSKPRQILINKEDGY